MNTSKPDKPVTTISQASQRRSHLRRRGLMPPMEYKTVSKAVEEAGL